MLTYLYDASYTMYIHGAWLYLVLLFIYLGIRYYKYREKINILDKHFSMNLFINEKDFTYRRDLVEKLQYEIYLKEFENNKKIVEDFRIKETEKEYYLNLWTHQVKTPIAAMNLILQGDFNKRGKEIKTELKKIGIYVDNIINYMKIEQNSSDFFFKEHSLEKIINKLLKNNSLLFIYKGLNLELKIKDCSIVTDEKWLLFALEQILLNAIKYTNKGSVSIFNEDSSPFTIHIKDTGVGISKSDLSRISDLGFTGENGRLDPNSTGIGLYITDKILKELGYEYKIISEVGKGTEFVINLERKKIYID